MIIAGRYSFNKGLEIIQRDYKNLLKEISYIIGTIDAGKCKKKKSLEKTMPGRLLYSPKDLNSAFKREFEQVGWQKQKVNCEYSNAFYEKNYKAQSMNSGAFREMDFLKNNLGVEVQFGKYAFMVYNVCAKMTIFHNLGYINAGVEIVPVKKFADEMSTGVSYFEQFVWDLQHRGVSNIDIPVLILGIDKSK
ncbi:MAG: BglII/BstYI family type II restriction endonuclease [Phycisphaerae bacterium]|nr:BglII/BstYI family type II restriction endonuclease [Phycisphaerae bacterium]